MISPSGVVDQDVDSAKLLHYRLNHLIYRISRRDIAYNRDSRAWPGRIDFTRDTAASSGIEIDHGHLGALPSEKLRNIFAYIAARAGNHRDLILQSHRSSIINFLLNNKT
jgi:hypothetical protein